MKNLTKEECSKALQIIDDYTYLGTCSYTSEAIGNDVEYEINVLKQLVNEHFDNPPLKFEELEEGMWVWDNSVYEKNYALIKRKFICANDLVVEMRDDECEDGDEYLGRVFEENRFYAKEVKYNDNIYK